MILDDLAKETDHYGTIEVRAYQLYEARGRQDGYAVEDWLQAEKEVLRATSTQQLLVESPSRTFDLEKPTAKQKAMRR